jgi:galactokinase/mevalonate kinase-like predicted kinase
MIFYAPYTGKHKVIEALNKLGGQVMRYNFTAHGLTSWTIE